MRERDDAHDPADDPVDETEDHGDEHERQHEGERVALGAERLDVDVPGEDDRGQPEGEGVDEQAEEEASHAGHCGIAGHRAVGHRADRCSRASRLVRMVVTLRPEIAALQPYRQGRPAAADAFKLSSNENPFPPLAGGARRRRRGERQPLPGRRRHRAPRAPGRAVRRHPRRGPGRRRVGVDPRSS